MPSWVAQLRCSLHMASEDNIKKKCGYHYFRTLQELECYMSKDFKFLIASIKIKTYRPIYGLKLQLQSGGVKTTMRKPHNGWTKWTSPTMWSTLCLQQRGWRITAVTQNVHSKKCRSAGADWSTKNWSVSKDIEAKKDWELFPSKTWKAHDSQIQGVTPD